MAVLIGLALASAALLIVLRLLARPTGAGAAGMRVVGRLALEPRRSIYVVEIGGRRFVVGVGDGPMAMLGELGACAEAAGDERSGTPGASGEAGDAERSGMLGPSGEAGGVERSGMLGPSGQAGGAERSGKMTAPSPSLAVDEPAVVRAWRRVIGGAP